jgi:hypothetical protein
MLNRSILRQALQATPDCLAPEQLEKLAADAAQKHPHVSQCLRCQSELTLLKAFESEEQLPDEGAAVAWIGARMERQLDQIKQSGRSRAAVNSTAASSWLHRLFGGGSVRWLVPATAVLVVAVAGAVLLHRPQEPVLQADAGNGPTVYRSQELQLVGPSGEVGEAPKTLQWKTFPGATTYKASVMEVDETPLWAGDTHDLVLTIPDAVRAKMLAGKTVLWRVTALDGEGRTLATSQVQRFSVQRKSPGSNGGALPR